MATTIAKCDIDHLSGYCIVHDSTVCATQPLAPMLPPRPCPKPTQLHDLAIFAWAISELDQV